MKWKMEDWPLARVQTYLPAIKKYHARRGETIKELWVQYDPEHLCTVGVMTAVERL